MPRDGEIPLENLQAPRLTEITRPSHFPFGKPFKNHCRFAIAFVLVF
jgi:hypothetical protein